MNDWLAIALSATVRKRAFRVALIVGSIIAIINYGDKLMGGTLALRDVIKILMTFLVPYGVSTYSSVSATQEAARKRTA
jgi:hypothetical protein